MLEGVLAPPLNSKTYLKKSSAIMMHFNDQQDNWVAEEIKNSFKNTSPPSKLEFPSPSQKHSMMAIGD